MSDARTPVLYRRICVFLYFFAGTTLQLPITGSLDARAESGKRKVFLLAEIGAGHIAYDASEMPVCCVLWPQFCESEVLIETTKVYLGFRHAE